jgi:signal peptidase I
MKMPATYFTRGEFCMKRKKIRRYTNSSIFYIVVGVILALGINQGLAFALSTDMPIVAVESNSMVPEFYKGDMLVLQGSSQESLAIGDVIVFDPPSGGTPVVHRIVEINTDGSFQTKGDANNGQLFYEKDIDFSQIHGRVVMIIPYVGWIKIGMIQYIVPNIMWILLGSAIIGLLYIGGRTFQGIHH